MKIGSLYKIEISDVLPSTCIHCNSDDIVYNKDKFNSFMKNKCIRINRELDPIHPLDYTYEVDIDNYQNDIQNFTKTLKKTLTIPSNIRKVNAEKARKALDKLRPEKIKEDWIRLFAEIINH